MRQHPVIAQFTLAVASAAAALVLATEAGAQADPPALLEDPEANLVEEVVVTARLPGPAWWRVSDADTTVYVLGLPDGPLPPGVSWDRSVLERRLKGANVLIDQPVVRVNLRGAPALLRLRNRMRSPTPLEETLAPALRARFQAARERIGRPASRYSGWMPIVAGERLVSDSQGSGAWSEPDDEVRRIARKMKVRVTSPTRDGRAFLTTAMESLTPQVHEQCLRGALDDAERTAAGGGVAPARAWAEGDVARALTEARSFNRCLLLLGGGAQMWRQGTQDQADLIAEALRTPGHAVAVVSLRRLLAEDGVLQQVRARGLSVAGPAAPES